MDTVEPTFTQHGSQESNSTQPSVGNRRRANWVVQIKDAEGQLREETMRAQDVFVLKTGDVVILPWQGVSPTGADAGSLLGRFLGLVAKDLRQLPISYRTWKKVPNTYKDDIWNTIKTKFFWEPIYEAAVKTYIFKELGKKWKDNRLHLYATHYDPTKTREENISNNPMGATTTEWAAYLDYRSEEKTKEICQKNGVNRSKQTIPHAGGSKKLKRRASEIAVETGQVVSRGSLYVATHKKKDGSYVNAEAQVVCEKILELESQENIPKEVSPNDSLGQVFGKEHSGRTRGLGSAIPPSVAFGTNYQQHNTHVPSSCNMGTSGVAASDSSFVPVAVVLQMQSESQARI